MSDLYLIALGSNVRHRTIGSSRRVLAKAVEALQMIGRVVAVASTVDSLPVGPSRRRFANSALILETRLVPEALLEGLKGIERQFGVRRGQRWSARVLDLDIILWSGGTWASPSLIVPHVAYRERGFVLRPASTIAADWRDPITGLTIKQLHTRLTRPRPAPR